jgi:transcriptional regulator GlxA family with amidase domain
MKFNHLPGNQFQDKLKEATEANLGDENFGVPELAKAMNMSRTTLHRKVVKYIKLSASSFIRQARLKKQRSCCNKTTLLFLKLPTK